MNYGQGFLTSSRKASNANNLTTGLNPGQISASTTAYNIREDTMLQALFAFSLSWGTGLKWESSIGAYTEVYLLKSVRGPVSLEAGGWMYETYRAWRANIWLSGGPRVSVSSLGFYPYLGLGWYTVHPLGYPTNWEYENWLHGDTLAFDGVLGMAGLSGEWDVPRTHLALWMDLGGVKFFNPHSFEKEIWTLGGGLMFRFLE